MENNIDWEYFSKKYNLILDNENYDDLEKTLEEVYRKGFDDGYDAAKGDSHWN